MRRAIILLAAAGLLTTPIAALALDTSESSLTRYQLIDIGTLGGDATWAYAMNASGQVTGASQLAGAGYQAFRAFLWDGKVMSDLGVLVPGDDASSFGMAINDAGQISGRSTMLCDDDDYACPQAAFLWDSGEMIGIPSDRSSLGPFYLHWGKRINASGLVLGDAVGWEGHSWKAFVWDGETTYDIHGLIHTYPGADYTFGCAINDSGNVVGLYGYWESGPPSFPWSAPRPSDPYYDDFFFTAGFIWDGTLMHPLDFYPFDINSSGYVVGVTTDGQAVLWDGVSLQGLGTLGGSHAGAHLINDVNQIAGISSIAGDTASHAFRWDDGTMRDLGNLGVSLSVRAINIFGQVTGSSGGRAFISDGTPMEDLNELISQALPDQPILQAGLDINDAGLILVDGVNSMGYRRAYVLTPISHLFSQLLDNAADVGPGRALEGRLTRAIRHYEAEKLGATCSALDGFAKQVSMFAGQRKPKVTQAHAEKLTEDARAIGAALGCP